MAPVLRQTVALLLAGFFSLSIFVSDLPHFTGEEPAGEALPEETAVEAGPLETLPDADESPPEDASGDTVASTTAGEAETPIILHLYSGDALPDFTDEGWAQTDAVILELHARLYTGDGDGENVPLSLIIPEGMTVTLRSSPAEVESFVLTSGAICAQPLIVNHGTLLLEEVELNGHRLTGDTPAVRNLGTLILRTGAGIVNASGPAIENGGQLAMEDGYIRQNLGGGVRTSGSFTLSGGSIDGNTAAGNGGGVLVSAGSFEMTGGALRGNTAGGSGGGVYLSGGSFALAGGAVTGNSAGAAGGGICLADGNLTLCAVVGGNSFTKNAAPALGADVYISGTAAGPVVLEGPVVVGPVGGLHADQPLEDILEIGPAGLADGAQVEIAGCPEDSAQPGARVAAKPDILTAQEAARFVMPSAQLAGTISAQAGDENHVVWESTRAQPPALTSVQPGYAASGLANTSGVLTLTFNRAMDPAAGRVTLNGAALTGGSWPDSQHHTLPYAFLADSTPYTVGVSGFKSADGLIMEADSRFSFTTADLDAPYLLSVSPNGLTASTDGAIVLVFSEAMANTHGRLSLYDDSTGQAVPLGEARWTDDRTLTAAFAGLATGTRHRLVVSGFRDLAGNTMFADTRLFSTLRPLVAAIAITGYEDGVLRFIPGGTKTLGVEVSGAGGLAPHNPTVLWASANTKVAKAEPQPNGSVLFHAGAAGSTVLTATSADGACTARFTMVVAPAEATLALVSHTVLLGGEAAEIAVSATGFEPLSQYAWLELYNADTLEAFPFDTNADAFTGAPVDCVLQADGTIWVSLTADAASAIAAASGPAWEALPPAVVVRLVAGVPGFTESRVADECVIHLPRPSGNAAWQTFHLTAASLTAHALKPEAARLTLRREYAPDADALPLAGCTVRFTWGYDALNSLFAFQVVDDETVAVKVIAPDVKAMKSSYKGTLEILTPDGEAVPVKQALTLKVNKKPPTVKAAAVKLNSFFPDSAVTVTPTAAGWDAIRENPAYATKNDALLRGPKAWLDCTTDENGNLLTLSSRDTAKHSGTLYLLATPTGWGGVEVAFTVKVSTARTPPAVQLKSAKASLYAEPALSTGAVLTLKPKRKNDSLTSLGAASVTVVPQADVPADKQAAYPNQTLYATGGFDVHSGQFTLTTAEGAVPVKSKVLLQVRFGDGDTGPAHQLAVSVNVMAKGAKVGLKTAKTTLTLNPAAGEVARLPVTTNIPGFDVAAYGGLTCELLNPKGHLAPTARIEDGSTLVLEASPSCSYGQSYKVRLTLPGANTAHKGGPDAALIITVKTATLKKAPAASLSVKGAASLTSPAVATVTVKLANYGGRLGAAPVFEYTTRAGESVGAANFTLVNTAAGKWAVGMAEGSALGPGSYRLRLAGWTSETGEAFGPSGWVTFKVTAPKSKVTRSAKTVKLYAAERDSRAVVKLSLPAGCPAPDAVTSRGGTGAFRVDTWPGGCVIRFAEGQPAGKVKARTLTIDLYANGRCVGTTTVKVAAQNI